METEKRFYKELNAIPGVPESSYAAIASAIRRRRTRRKTVWAVAALGILAVGITRITNTGTTDRNTITASQDITVEVIDELQTVSDYLNGNTLEDELYTFALVNPALF